MAQITPLIKKPSLDPSLLASYRPVSNLRTFGKLLERLVQSRIRPHLISSPLFSMRQSAYRPKHSTETACIDITDKLFMATDSSTPTLMVSLDLSAAFDCVVHLKLLTRLSQDFGLSGKALSWVQSYLSDRSQTVSWNGIKSNPVTLSAGVPQGSVLGPLFFTAYTSPIARLIDSYGVTHHSYADDTTLILNFNKNLVPTTIMNDCTCALSNWFMHIMDYFLIRLSLRLCG
jgi:hypothetical protein